MSDKPEPGLYYLTGPGMGDEWQAPGLALINSCGNIRIWDDEFEGVEMMTLAEMEHCGLALGIRIPTPTEIAEAQGWQKPEDMTCPKCGATGLEAIDWGSSEFRLWCEGCQSHFTTEIQCRMREER